MQCNFDAILKIDASKKTCEHKNIALQPEEITSNGTRVSCVFYQKKCLYEKKSGNLVKDPRIYNYWEVLGLRWRHHNSKIHRLDGYDQEKNDWQITKETVISDSKA